MLTSFCKYFLDCGVFGGGRSMVSHITVRQSVDLENPCGYAHIVIVRSRDKEIAV